MLTPEQSRAYEKLSVEGVYENGYSGASVRSTSVDSSRFNESGHLQEVELQTLESYLKKFGVDYKGNPNHKGERTNRYRKAENYLGRSTHITSAKLKIKLFRDKLKEERCESCKLTEWMGQKIPLELHHVDGDRFNNELVNLQVLCPNCHALTDNYSGRNKGN